MTKCSSMKDLENKFLIMLGRVITVACSRMDRQVLEKAIQW